MPLHITIAIATGLHQSHLTVILVISRIATRTQFRVSEASDMDDTVTRSFCEWSWKENKLFELALAMVDEKHPERWEIVAAMVGGKKSAGEVQQHYVILLEDLHVIESGKLDYKLGEIQPSSLVVCKESMVLSHDDN
jgi:hypothetical protein